MQQMDEGHVLTCKVNQCGYNDNEICRAPNINVGDEHPTCDTYTTEQVQKTNMEMPDVAMCKVTECKFNQSSDCSAPGITVSHHSDHADCMTFRAAS